MISLSTAIIINLVILMTKSCIFFYFFFFFLLYFILFSFLSFSFHFNFYSSNLKLPKPPRYYLRYATHLMPQTLTRAHSGRAFASLRSSLRFTDIFAQDHSGDAAAGEDERAVTAQSRAAWDASRPIAPPTSRFSVADKHEADNSEDEPEESFSDGEGMSIRRANSVMSDNSGDEGEDLGVTSEELRSRRPEWMKNTKTKVLRGM
jgi:hypothetical protein